MIDNDIDLRDAFSNLKCKMAFLTEVGITTEMSEKMEDQNGDVAIGFYCFVRDANDEMAQFGERLNKYVKKATKLGVSED